MSILEYQGTSRLVKTGEWSGNGRFFFSGEHISSSFSFEFMDGSNAIWDAKFIDNKATGALITGGKILELINVFVRYKISLDCHSN